jgi:hypothetical protein
MATNDEFGAATLSQSIPMGVSPTSQSNNRRMAEPVNFSPPIFNFVPPMWVYEDPSKKVQGPFTSEQMHGWYKEGYFPPGLPIKCVGDTNYISLVQFVDKFGSESPFLDSLREQEELEKEYFLQTKRQTQISNVNSTGFLLDSNRPFGFSNNLFNEMNPIGFQASSDDHPSKSFIPENQFKFDHIAPVASTGQGLLNIMHQQSNHEMIGSVERPPSQKSASPIKSRATSASSTRVVSPKVDESELVSDLSEITAQNHRGTSDFKPKLSANVFNSPAKPVKKSEAPKVMIAPEAPWANLSNNNPKTTLNKIQEVEQQKKEVRAKKEAIDAENNILKEAAQIAKQSRASDTSIVANSQWGNVSLQTDSKKSLTQIMEAQAKQAENDNAARSFLSKGYASTVASGGILNSRSTVPSKASNVVATGPVIKPSNTNLESGDGWNVVGKPKNTISVNSAASTGVKASNAKKTHVEDSSKTHPPATKNISTIKGASTQFSQWCRSALKGVSKESSLNSNFLLN